MIKELADFPLSEQVLDAATKFIKKKYQSTQLVDVVKELEKEYKQDVFDNLSRQEEFDWTGLEEYIDKNLLSKIPSVFLSPNKDVREATRKQVYICAYSSAKADTIARQRQVNRLMDKVLLQVGNFLCGQKESFDSMTFNEVTDQICARLDDWGEEIKDSIEQQTQKLEERYKKLHDSLEYQSSFAKLVDHIKLPQPIDSLFSYRDPKVGFYGRENEIAFLDGFLDCEKTILFTAVNGPAGSGKSKFLYEYAKGLEDNPNWKCLFIQNKKDLDKFIDFYEWEYPVNLLVVIDYAGDYANLIGEWLVSLKTGKCPPKMRIVLLEREGVGKNRKDNNVQENNLTYPMWYERMLMVHSNDDIKTMLYTTGKDATFLELPTLSDDAFKDIMEDYAKEKGRALSESEKREILEYCKTIENNEQGICRPLILLFVVDAWINEGKHHQWNIQELLLKIINRYKKHWEKTLCEENKKVFTALERLMVYATATGGWEIKNQLPEFLQKDFLTVNEFCGTPEKQNQLFRSVNEKFEWDEILSPLEPDLIGELFVLDYLQNTFKYENMIEAFNAKPHYLLFILRSIVDFADEDKYSDLFDDGLRKLLNESLIIAAPEIYARLLVILMSQQKKENAMITLKYLQELACDSEYAETEEIVLVYAEGLFSLAVDQEVKEAELTVEKLEKLARDSRYAGNEEIVLMYAKGLFNLAAKQEVKKVELTVKKLEGLARDSRYAGNEEIVLGYAKGLFNLATVQEVKEAELTVEKLEGLARDSRYAGNEEIVLGYAKGLFNLATVQEVKEAELTVEKLEGLARDNRYAENEEIVLEYAKGLFNLAAVQEVKEAELTVEKLEGQARNSRYAGNEEIVLRYARGLMNLAADQEVKEAELTVEKLEGLARDSRYAGNEEIMLEYAKSLVNLAAAQEVKEAEVTVEKLGNLACDSRYTGNKEFVLMYAMGLANLGFNYYSQHNYEMAEKRFAQAHERGDSSGSTNLSYMIRRRETRNHSADEVKEILLPALNDKDSFAIMNMALYLAEYEKDWHGADNLIFSTAETVDFSGVIGWWSALDDLEGLLVMTWLERNKICVPSYTLHGKKTLELLRSKYPHIPDWIIEIREE